MSELRPLMTPQELAKALNVPLSWVYGRTREAKQTGFPVVRAGKYRRFDLVRVMKWLEEQGE